MTCLLPEGIFFFGFLCFCNIKKIYNFQFFLVQVVCKSLFFMIWLQVFLKNSYKWFS